MIYSLSTSNTLTMYWEKPVSAPESYQIFCNGVQVGNTAKTHYTLEGLQAETEYRIEVRSVGELLCRTDPEKENLDVTAWGAAGDGKAINTERLQAVIDACGVGQRVYFPKGVYLTGSLRLHSDMELYLEEGAVLQGTDDFHDYLPLIPSRFEGIERECYSSVLNLGHMDHAGGVNCRNVLIHGHGTIASGGKELAKRIIRHEREKQKAYMESLGKKILECENENTIPGRVRPRLINMSNCGNIRISGLTLKDGASWNVHMIYCDGIVTDHCTFRSEDVWNGDGWDPDSSENCVLFGCEFYTGDDAVAIKSGKNPEGNEIGRPCRCIRVFDCFSAAGHGITIGSEMSGGIEDVKIWDCDLMNSLNGIEIKGTKKRGGYVRDIEARDCQVPRVLIHAVAYNDDGEGAAHPPVFSDCRYEGLEISGQYFDTHGDKKFHVCNAIELEGFDVPGYEVRDVCFKDIRFTGVCSMIMNHCIHVKLENIRTGDLPPRKRLDTIKQ